MTKLITTYFKEKINQPIHIAPLAMFRVVFGAVMFSSVIRFILKGWVYDLYIQPTFYFTYYGFEWVKPLCTQAMYILFAVMAFSYFLVMLGCLYRVAIVTAFLAFTYIELIDKTNYLNHYYFVSVVSFLLIFFPANKYFSLDVIRKPFLKITQVPRWTIDALKFQLAILYIYAGLSKLNYDWLVRAMPLKIWLPEKSYLPVIGSFMDYEWVAYLFSWLGAIYDLSIVFFLLNKKTRLIAYIFVVIFHVMTKLLLPVIGMFPYVMIFCTLIFFSEEFHKKIIDWFLSLRVRALGRLPIIQEGLEKNARQNFPPYKWNFFNCGSTTPTLLKELQKKIVLYMLGFYFILQLLIPIRFLLYPGKLFWTEQGYRFSWRVMLMEKAGKAFFHVKDSETGKEIEVTNGDYLTKNQEKMMSTQPDMILQFAHFLKKKYEMEGIKNPQVRVESYVTLNGSRSTLFIDSTVDLTKEKEGFLPKKWILPFNK